MRCPRTYRLGPQWFPSPGGDSDQLVVAIRYRSGGVWSDLKGGRFEITGIAMDLATSRSDRPYWRSTPGLLLSVYQLRAASVQIAFTLAHVAAVVALWQQAKTGGSAP